VSVCGGGGGAGGAGPTRATAQTRAAVGVETPALLLQQGNSCRCA
jgi:hypothetical protein